MRLHRRPELRHSSGRHYVDIFGAVSPRWTLRAGTLAAGLQAATAANWLGNAVSNGEFMVDTDPWYAAEVTLTRVDSAVDPGAPSGGVDAWCAKLVKLTITASRYMSLSLTTVIGANYAFSHRAYSPSANTNVNAATMRLEAAQWTSLYSRATSIEDVWQVWSDSRVASASPGTVYMQCAGTTIGDTVYFDAITFYRQNTVATLAWGSPNIIATLDLAIPAAPSVVPFSAIFRYTDTLNYWEIRTTPNTAGNDLAIIEVVAGVPTVRASADIDWTAGGTDQMRVAVSGTTITVTAKKSGAPAFTAAASYATMATGLTATAHGLMFFGTGVNRCTRWESH